MKPARSLCLPKSISQKIRLSSLGRFISEINFRDRNLYKNFEVGEFKAGDDEPLGLNEINQFVKGQHET